MRRRRHARAARELIFQVLAQFGSWSEALSARPKHSLRPRTCGFAFAEVFLPIAEACDLRKTLDFKRLLLDSSAFMVDHVIKAAVGMMRSSHPAMAADEWAISMALGRSFFEY
ncbi:hypothetical protein [Chromobacterium piscinae]|uniref:hypothetical protein n=1 Tax=Chromobacterium piscinae TaxID=686831 RepID=UPI003F7FD32D